LASEPFRHFQPLTLVDARLGGASEDVGVVPTLVLGVDYQSVAFQ